MRKSGVLPVFSFVIASFLAGTGACGGQVEIIADGGAASSSSGSSGSVSASSGVTTSSGSSGAGSSTSSGFGSSTGSGSGGEGDSGFGSSSGVFDSGFADVTMIGDSSVACTMSIPVLELDGGMNVPCESCLNMACPIQECACIQDPNLLSIDDAGDMAPGCDVFINCVYGDFVQILLTSDGGLAQDLQTAITDCSAVDNPPFSGEFINLGDNFISCLVANCGMQCLP